jgi:hypothetical protein
MPTPFAAIEARVNAGVHSRLANATATIDGTDTVDGVFDNGFTASLGGLVEDAAPSFRCLTTQVPAVAHGTPVTINAVDYTVIGVQPDGTGAVRLLLQVV